MTRALVVLFLGIGMALPALAADPPPSIDDLDGATFLLVAKGPEFNLAGNRGKEDVEFETTVTKTGADTVSLSSVLGGMIFTAYYVDGFLLQAFSSGESPPQDGSALQVQVRGKPGKLKLKGTYITYAAGPGFNVLRVLKIKGKQLP